jgi:hypothetical protein
MPRNLLCRGCGIFNRDPGRLADIEVLEEIKLHDGDAFRSGDDWVTYPPMPQIDREAHRRASSADGASITLIN